MLRRQPVEGASVFLAASQFPADGLPSRLLSPLGCPPSKPQQSETQSFADAGEGKKKVSLLVERGGGGNHGKILLFHISKQWGENNGMFALNFVLLWLQ